MAADPRRTTERLDARSAGAIAHAATLLRGGGTVAFPTETVYGLGADAFNPEAVARIFAAKARPGWDPLIAHIADRTMLEAVAVMPSEARRRVGTLIEHLWPGPLTLLLPRTPVVPDAVTAGRPLVGVRMPAHPVALALIQAAGVPVAAPSANRFGGLSPTTAEHVLAGLDGRIDAVLDGGPCKVGVESTVLDPTVWPMVLYRPGAVTPAMLEELCGPGSVRVFTPAPRQFNAPPEALPSPGVGLRHYAPRARLVLVQMPNVRFTGVQESLIQPLARLQEHGGPVGVMLPEDWLLTPETALCAPLLFPWGPWQRPEILAQRLFAGLHALDQAGVESILCPLPTGEGIAQALRDRLEKAAKPGAP